MKPMQLVAIGVSTILLLAATQPPVVGVVTTAQSDVEKPHSSTISHAITLHGRRLTYTATASTTLVPDPDGKPVATLFSVAYVAPRRDNKPRPVTFVFNGGPGGSSAFLHLGSFGPKRLAFKPLGTPVADIGSTPLIDNPDSLLDQTDLVFIDAVDTGYSRALPGADPKKLWGIEQDLDVFSWYIRDWVARHRRETSPKFLIGASYGGTRAAGLSLRLQQANMPIDGIVFLSSMISVMSRDASLDQYYVTTLPSVAATAWFHHRASGPATLEATLRDAEEFASGEYIKALAQGAALPTGQRTVIAQRLSAMTGLSIDNVLSSNLRIDPLKYTDELLADRHLVLGTLDTRLTRAAGPPAKGSSGEPLLDQRLPAFQAAAPAYLTGDLGYKTTLRYLVLNSGPVQSQWDWSRGSLRPEYPWVSRSMINDLSETMTVNNCINFLVFGTTFDFAQPYFATKWDFSHIFPTNSTSNRVKWLIEPSNHMSYIEGSTNVSKYIRDFIKFHFLDGCTES